MRQAWEAPLTATASARTFFAFHHETDLHAHHPGPHRLRLLGHVWRRFRPLRPVRHREARYRHEHRLDLINSEDYQVEFQPATGWYQIRSIKDPTIRLKAKEEELAAVLRSAKNLQAPTVRIIYPASFVSASRQDAYETQIRSLLQPIRAVVSFQRRLD
jgi:hypothetical protein